jgi:flagellar motor switch protein FliG
MALTGKQKAAILLMSLDPVTAAELLKGVKPETVQELAVELAFLEASGVRDSKQSMEVASQFCQSLAPTQGSQFKKFLETLLKSSVGIEKAKQIQTQIDELLDKRDPFKIIRAASSRKLAEILSVEHPQAVAIVLSELPSKKSSEVLGLVDEKIRLGAISGMSGAVLVNAEAKKRIAEIINKKLETRVAAPGAPAGAGAGAGDEEGEGEHPLRKTAMVIRNLAKEIREGLMTALQERDPEAAEKINELMVVWEDMTQITDRSMQEALRGIDAGKLALALCKAEEQHVKKIKANISERAAASIDEETSLMAPPKKEDIIKAREELVDVWRDMNKKGTLNFIEEE